MIKQNLCFGQTPCPIPDFQSLNCEYCPSITPEEEPVVIPPEHKLYDRLQQAEGKVIYLQKKLNEHLDKKRKSKYD